MIELAVKVYYTNYGPEGFGKALKRLVAGGVIRSEQRENHARLLYEGI